MKTVDALKEIVVLVNGEAKETVEVKNPCQMWRKLDELFTKHGDAAELKVFREDGTVFKDFTLVKTKDGKLNKVNSVKETNRWMMMKAKGITPPKKVIKHKKDVVAEAEKAVAQPAEQKEAI